MRKKVTQRLVSGVLCLAMGITLISPVTSRAAETSEPTTQATTESASTETTTEVPVTTEVQVAPSEDVLFDHFYDTGILPATLQSKDGNDLELVTPYTAEGQNGTIKVNLPEFDGTQLLDEDGKMITKGVTVYEEISLNGVVYAIVVCDSLEDAENKARSKAYEYFQELSYVDIQNLNISVDYQIGSDQSWHKGSFVTLTISAPIKSAILIDSTRYEASVMVMIEHN